MGSWTIYGILLIVGIFMTLVSLILSQINIESPFTGQETSVLELVINWIVP